MNLTGRMMLDRNWRLVAGLDFSEDKRLRRSTITK